MTGELGDQLFGSNTMKRAIDAGIPLDGPWQQAAYWEQPLAKMEEAGVYVTVAELEAYLAPQLALSPVPIVSLFDFLWWINYSMKWQHVALRLVENAFVASK